MPIDDGEPDQGEFAEYIEGLADPERPIQSRDVIAGLLGDRFPPPHVLHLAQARADPARLHRARDRLAIPAARRTSRAPSRSGRCCSALATEPWAPLLVIGVYIVGGLIAFPVLILIAATAAAFGPGHRACLCGGRLARERGRHLSRSASRIGRDALRARDRPAAQARAAAASCNGGVLAIAAIRLVPIAPFTVVNLVAGASEIRLGAFIAGTILGMAPGWIVMSALGHQMMRILSGPSAADVALLAGVIAIWIALAGGVQVAFAKFGKRP